MVTRLLILNLDYHNVDVSYVKNKAKFKTKLNSSWAFFSSTILEFFFLFFVFFFYIYNIYDI